MILLPILLALAIWATISTVREVRRDGYRQVPTDWSRAGAHSALDSAESGRAYR